MSSCFSVKTYVVLKHTDSHFLYVMPILPQMSELPTFNHLLYYCNHTKCIIMSYSTSYLHVYLTMLSLDQTTKHAK
jgi:hypothetical protein